MMTHTADNVTRDSHQLQTLSLRIKYFDVEMVEDEYEDVRILYIMVREGRRFVNEYSLAMGGYLKEGMVGKGVARVTLGVMGLPGVEDIQTPKSFQSRQAYSDMAIKHLS